MSLSADDLKKVAIATIDKYAAELANVSDEIWRNPELKYEEHHAHQILTDFLEKHKFPVERNFVTDTGFRSVYNDVNKPNIAVLCEYDALPDIGHACGHNLIAEVGVGAAIGIKAAIDAASDVGQKLGQLTVLGCPGEESGGGKIDFIRTGAFDTISAAMMSHPWPGTQVDLGRFISREMVTVEYHGQASHAAGFPWQGVNALDAAVMAYNNISVLRQQLKPAWRVHGVITNGGAKPNIIPEYTGMLFYLRATNVKQLQILKDKVTPCFTAAAAATGCKVNIKWGDKPYDNLICNKTLATLYETNARNLGVIFNTDPVVENKKVLEIAQNAVASTDMGNVSHVVPGLHPIYYIGGLSFNHTRPFTALSGSPKAQPYTLDQAKALAMTAIDTYCQPHLTDTMSAELQADLKAEQENA